VVSEEPSGNTTNEIHVLLERMKKQFAISFALSVVLLLSAVAVINWRSMVPLYVSLTIGGAAMVGIIVTVVRRQSIVRELRSLDGKRK
jgi:archaellum biogenesis protein FlaJ (TadC family)